ncbi:unnamed protein product [Closterium sp. NIES-54]
MSNFHKNSVLCHPFPSPVVAAAAAAASAKTTAAAAAAAAAAARGPFNVTLQSVTVMRDTGMVLPPSVFFSCKDDASHIALPQVHSILTKVEFSGSEPWQPVTQLGHEQCKQCGIYQRHFFLYTSTVAEFPLCPANFSLPATQEPTATGPHRRNPTAVMSGGVAVIDIPGVVYVSLACATCVAPPPPPAPRVTEFEPAVTDVTGTWVTTVILSFAFLIAIAMCCVIALILRHQHRRRQQHDEMEKSRFLDLHGDDSSSGIHEHSQNALYLDKDPEHGDESGAGGGMGGEGSGESAATAAFAPCTSIDDGYREDDFYLGNGHTTAALHYRGAAVLQLTSQKSRECP